MPAFLEATGKLGGLPSLVPAGIAGPDPMPSRIPRAEVRAMTYMLYKVLRKLPRPVLLGLLLVLLTAVARA
jgi:hypothetical protein